MDERYPIGRVAPQAGLSAGEREALIAQIERLPGQVRAAVGELSATALDTPYREGGWTARQVVHHLADSHLNAYMRMRLALTEEQPLIRTYREERWAELADARDADPALSLALLDALHGRMTTLLRAIPEGAFARTATHPDWGEITLDWLVQSYAWHGRHHVEHIKLAIRRANGSPAANR